MSGNNAWFDQNCDPDESPQQQEVVASGGGATNTASDGVTPTQKTVNQVLENLIGQCYSGDVPKPTKNFIPPDLVQDPNEFLINWRPIYDVLNGLGISPPDTSSVYVSFPNPEDPNSGKACTDRESSGTIDCTRDRNKEFEACIKDHLDCIFKPYLGGGWKPPKADCKSFVPKRQYGVSNKVCIADCVSPRIPIYEHILGGATDTNARFTSNSNLSLSSDGVVTIEFWWDDNPSTAGVAVNTISVAGYTFTRNQEKGRKVKTFSLSAGNYNITYSGLASNGSHYVTNKYGNNKNIKFEDNDGTDENARLTIISSSAAKNHLYSKSATPPGGYTTTGILFYANETAEPLNSIPIYVSYSASTVDTMLTARPDLEQATMDAAGMGARDEVLFYAYDESDEMYSELLENERAAPLHRYYSPESQDHMYTLEPIDSILDPDLKNNRYVLKTKAETYLNIDYECRKGGASYDNTLFWYVTDGIGGDPIYGKVMLPNATDASGKFVTKIPKEVINQYIPCSLGFGIVPDGDGVNSGVSDGDVLTFSNTGNGWRTNLNSAQSNLSFFSQRRFNRSNKEYTKWPNRSWMYWEDLINGDDDYDDVKFSYRVRYGASEYYYEGIQCFVFENPANPVYADLTPKACGTTAITEPFTNVEVSKTECGSFVEDARSGGGSGCGNCVGSIAYQSNRVQTTVALRDLQVSLRSHGGMTGGYGDCTRFSYKISVNGNQVWYDDPHVRDWGRIGSLITTFNVSKGDEITFEVIDILQGHYSARVSPAFSMRDEITEEFIATWTVNLSTQAQNYNSQQPAQSAGRTTEATEPCGLAISGQLFAICSDGSQQNYTNVLSNKSVLSNTMTPSTSCGIQVIRGKKVVDMSPGQTGYITTKIDGGMTVKLKYTIVDPYDLEISWQLIEVKDYGPGGYEVNDQLRIFIGDWSTVKQTYNRNQYSEDKRRNEKYYLGFKVTAINDVQCPDPSNNQGRISDIQINNEVYSYKVHPYLVPTTVVNNRSVTNNEYKINVNSLVQSLFLYDNGYATSFDEYYLREQAAGRQVIFKQDYLDVRGFRFRVAFRIEYIKSWSSGDAYEYPEYGWFANVSVDTVSSWGKRYSEYDALTIQWPPARIQNTDGNEPSAPYYPKQTNLPKDVLVRDRTTNRFKRNARWAIYQESHDKNSNVWYSNQSSFKPSQNTTLDLIISDVD
jgi:hypothetical protein